MASHKSPPRWVLPCQIGAVLLLLVGLELAVGSGRLNRVFFASPSQIADEFVYMIRTGTLLPHLVYTLQEFAVGYLISVVLGVGIGVLFVTFPKTELLLSAFMAAAMAVPKTAIMPLLIIWFGIGFKSKVVLVILFCMFNILFNTVTGAKETRREYLKVAAVFQASRLQMVFQVLLPAALPSIFSGLRVTAATAITGVIFAEMSASKGGLGYLLNESQAVLNTPRLFLIIILVTVLSVLLVNLVNLSERLVCRRWKHS